MSDQQIRREVNAFVDLCWSCYPGTVNEWAKKAGLCPSTIWRLARGQTKNPQYRTLRRMGAAAGLPIQLIQNTGKVLEPAA